jgi:phytoene synthase
MLPPEATATIDPADLAACRRQLRIGSRSFYFASRLLPRGVRDAATVLYAFCRLADDAIDEAGGCRERVAELHARLDAVYAGTPRPEPTDRALARVVAEWPVPRELLDALLEGLEWDACGHRCADFDGLSAYAARVAGSVGVMMALLLGARDPRTLARACDLGVAMQLTNIARDVGEDARAGRLYLPETWLREAGIDPDAWLAEPRWSEALAGVVERQLAVADALYRRARAGIAALPAGSRPGIEAARLIYAEIGAEVRRGGLDPVSRRAIVPGRRKLRLLGRAFGRVPMAAPDFAASPLPATRFLLAAAEGVPHPREPAVSELPWWDLHGRWVWTIELFLRLETRQRLDSRVREASK